MYYVMRASAPSLHRESTDSLISIVLLYTYTIHVCMHVFNYCMLYCM